MRQGRRKGRVSLLRRKAVGETAGQHGQWERLQDIDTPPGAGPHLNGADAGVEVEGPRGVAVAAVRGGGGGVIAGATTATAVGFVVVVPPSAAPWLARVVFVGHQRRWRSTPVGGIAHQGGGVAKGGWGSRPLEFGSSGSGKKPEL
jgi:hypothetical protein